MNLILIRDGKVLLQRRHNTGFEDGNYGVPAGHLDGGETVREGCAREMKEEIGVDIKPDDVHIAHVLHRKNPSAIEYVDFFLTVDRYEGEVRNCEPDKCDDLRWFSLDALPDNMIGYIRETIGHIRNGVSYSEWGWE